MTVVQINRNLKCCICRDAAVKLFIVIHSLQLQVDKSIINAFFYYLPYL